MTQSAAISLKSRASGAGTGVDNRRSVAVSAAGTADSFLIGLLYMPFVLYTFGI
jgi:hypothetical protein